MRQDMDADREVGIKYASKYAGISNYWKYFIGQTRGLKRLKVYEDKQKIEADFAAWVNADPDRKAKYGNVLSDIENVYKVMSDYTLQRWYYVESVIRGGEIMSLAQSFSGLAAELKAEKPDAAKIARMQENLRKAADRHFKNYNQPTDVKLLTAMLQMYYENVPVDQQPE